MNEKGFDNKWCSKDINSVLREFDTKRSGLSDDEAYKRLKIYGLNNFGEEKKLSFFKVLISQFKNWLTLVLIFASVVSLILGEKIDSIVIILLVVLSALFGFYQEYKAERTLVKLKKYVKRYSNVFRSGRLSRIEHEYIVPGDIVSLHIGDIVPADIRLIKTDALSLNEAILTGESFPVIKEADVIISPDSLISDMKNMVFMGTSVVEGNALGVVVETGLRTQFGKIVKVVKENEPETDFQIQISKFSRFLFRLIILMTVFIFLSNAILNKGIFSSFMFAIALAVGIAPEMLPAIITVTLSQGAIKMAKKKVVVKKLAAVEDFGNINTLCMDKTGTLTEGNFTLFDYKNNDGIRDKKLIIYSMLCTEGASESKIGQKLNPTDRAIWESYFARSYKNEMSKYKVIDENEFDYERRRMSVLVKSGDETFLIVKGSPESIISISSFYYKDNKKLKLSEKIKKFILNEVKKYEKRGLRAISLALRYCDIKKSNSSDEKELIYLGIILFKDPIKTTTKVAIEKFLDMGISLKILSGDSLTVTKSIAKESGIEFSDNEVITGDELKNCTRDEFVDYAKSCIVFARVSPIQKYEIVKVLNYEGHIVGFLGDGVNDAPALKESDVGITVDTGTDVAKEASDIILLQKDLKVLVDGIEAGRKTFGNIMKYILNTISANFGNMFTVALSSLFLNFIPLLPKQILLNNLISDIPLFAIATDNVDEGFTQKPNKWNLNYIKNFMIYFGFISSVFDLCLIIPMAFLFKVSPSVFQTAWFVQSSISEMLVTFAIRTKLPFYKSKPSKWLFWLSVISILSVVFLAIFEISIFSFAKIPKIIWFLIIFDLFAYFYVTELVKKRFFRKYES